MQKLTQIFLFSCISKKIKYVFWITDVLYRWKQYLIMNGNWCVFFELVHVFGLIHAYTRVGVEMCINMIKYDKLYFTYKSKTTYFNSLWYPPEYWSYLYLTTWQVSVYDLTHSRTNRLVASFVAAGGTVECTVRIFLGGVGGWN